MKRGPNPGKGSFARCVKAVKAKGGAYDPNAVCAAARRRKRNVPPIPIGDLLGQAADVSFVAPSVAKAFGVKKRKKRNPAEAAAAGYAEFHGCESEELIKVEKTVHFHRHLSGAGELRKMIVYPIGKPFRVPLSNFGGAMLAFNEKKDQLFIEGGNQAVNLKTFGITTPHEIETLGEVRVIEYYTTKDHLGSEGGTAIYVHRLHKPYPILIYRVRDEQLEFSGGAYEVLPEGIDR